MRSNKKAIYNCFANTVNKILSIIGLRLQRVKPKIKSKQKTKEKKDDLIWGKAAMLPPVLTLVDIGVGPKGTIGLYKHFPEARLIFIDPLEECRTAVNKYLEDDNHLFIACAIGSSNGTAKINIARKPSRSSLLERKHHYMSEGIQTREIAIKKLDDALEGLDLEEPIGLKIDTEGYELEVLKGAPVTLSKSLFVITEFHLTDARKYKYTLQDLVDYLKDAGFYAFTMLKDGRNIVFLSNKFNDY